MITTDDNQSGKECQSLQQRYIWFISSGSFGLLLFLANLKKGVIILIIITPFSAKDFIRSKTGIFAHFLNCFITPFLRKYYIGSN